MIKPSIKTLKAKAGKKGKRKKKAEGPTFELVMGNQEEKPAEEEKQDEVDEKKSDTNDQEEIKT